MFIDIFPDRSRITFTVYSRLALYSASSITLSYPPTLSDARKISRLLLAQRFFRRRDRATSCRPGGGSSSPSHHIPNTHRGVAALWQPSGFLSSIGHPDSFRQDRRQSFFSCHRERGWIRQCVSPRHLARSLRYDYHGDPGTPLPVMSLLCRRASCAIALSLGRGIFCPSCLVSLSILSLSQLLLEHPEESLCWWYSVLRSSQTFNSL